MSIKQYIAVDLINCTWREQFNNPENEEEREVVKRLYKVVLSPYVKKK